MNEARIRIRGRWDNPRVVLVEDYPKYIYIKAAEGLLKAYKRIDHTASPGATIEDLEVSIMKPTIKRLAPVMQNMKK